MRATTARAITRNMTCHRVVQRDGPGLDVWARQLSTVVEWLNAEHIHWVFILADADGQCGWQPGDYVVFGDTRPAARGMGSVTENAAHAAI